MREVSSKEIYIFLSFLIALFDQVTKYLARTFIDPSAGISVLPFLHLVNFRNEGAAFGLFRSLGSEVLIIISMSAVTFIIYLLIKGEGGLWLSLMLGGATGNLIDRILFGGVTDFIDVFVGRFHWPAFNIADSALTIGVILMLLSQLSQSMRKITNYECQ